MTICMYFCCISLFHYYLNNYKEEIHLNANFISIWKSPNFCQSEIFVDPKFPRVKKIWANENLGQPFFGISVCNFQSMKSLVELNNLLLTFSSCYISRTWYRKIENIKKIKNYTISQSVGWHNFFHFFYIFNFSIPGLGNELENDVNQTFYRWSSWHWPSQLLMSYWNSFI